MSAKPFSRFVNRLANGAPHVFRVQHTIIRQKNIVVTNVWADVLYYFVISGEAVW